MKVYERIKERRKELNLSPETVCNALNISKSTLYRYESPSVDNLPLSLLEPLAKVLKTNPAYLMGWTDDKDPNWVMKSKKLGINENFKILQAQNNLSLEFISKNTNIDINILQDIVNGKNDGLSLNGEQVFKLARLFGVTVDELYGNAIQNSQLSYEDYSEDTMSLANAYFNAPVVVKNIIRKILDLEEIAESAIENTNKKHA